MQLDCYILKLFLTSNNNKVTMIKLQNHYDDVLYSNGLKFYVNHIKIDLENLLLFLLPLVTVLHYTFKIRKKTFQEKHV